MNAPLKNKPKHFLDLSDHDSATLKAIIADAKKRKLARGGLAKGVPDADQPLNGKVLAGGADFQLILGNGTQAHLDARYVIELDDGTRVFVQNTALRVASLENSQRIMRGQPVPPDAVYFRCQPRLEAASPAWASAIDSAWGRQPGWVQPRPTTRGSAGPIWPSPPR